MRPAAEPAWETLQAAFLQNDPNCFGDPRYIADPADLPEDERADMWTICRTCPILYQCIDYAITEKPAAGWWPSHNLKGRPQ